MSFFAGSVKIPGMGNPKPRLALFIAAAFPLVGDLAAQTFFNGQNAIGVIGQANFTDSTSSNQPDRVNNPSGVAYDPVSGKIYLADMGNHRVLRYASAASAQAGAFPECVFGQETFVANSANQGLGAPTQRTLSSPRGLAVDSRGRLWVVDGGNQRVLRFDNAANLGVNPAASAVLGQVNFTTAGSGATQNTFGFPVGVAIGSADQLWVTDRANHRVLRFDAVTGKANGANADLVLGQTTFTGTAAATSAQGLNFPLLVALDSNGSLWISEQVSNRVKRHDNAAAIAVNGSPADGVLGQVNFTNSGGNAGGALGPIGFISPSGLYADAKGDLWVADLVNRRILRFGNAATLADGAAANLVLGQPDFVTSGAPPVSAANFIAVHLSGGPDGGVLVSDSNHRLLRFDPVNVAPTITLSGPKSRTTRAKRLVIRGTATDSDGSLASMSGRLNNKTIRVTGTTSWSVNAALKPGRNTIRVQSIDNLGLASGLVTATVTRR